MDIFLKKKKMRSTDATIGYFFQLNHHYDDDDDIPALYKEKNTEKNIEIFCTRETIRKKPIEIGYMKRER